MFSGITQGLFSVVAVDKSPTLVKYTVELSANLTKHLKVGASIAVDGVCQTVVAINETHASFEAIQQTLDVTTLGVLQKGDQVSIERSICYGDEIGGHEVSGHVSGTTKVVAREETNNNLTLTLQGDKAWIRYVFSQGFIALNGSSLTVADVDFKESTFKVCLIPETLRVTNFENKKIGDELNIEVEPKTKAIVDTVEKMLKEKMYEAV